MKYFEEFDDLDKACNKWLKLFNDIIKKSFKKIRICNTKKSKALDQLYSKRKSIKQKLVDAENIDSLATLMDQEKKYEDVDEEIDSFCSKKKEGYS